ncbi:MAG: serine/threonine protein kinase, partial [Planctomycetes bacterium]|nr:serine/threonine protein kinase [Planctomycetota bacterium]
MLTPGTRIGGLLIHELLGKGGMGEVYRAEQLALKRPVAVKRIAGRLLDSAEALVRFEREAQCIAKVQSVHVVQVHDFGRFADETGEMHCLLVMELIDGGISLRHVMSAPLAWRDASSLALQAAEGLAAAAEFGVVHRDIKPENIMLTRKGVAKLVDFGLARLTGSAASTDAPLGTPNYMSPEACQGLTVDGRGDLYSLGCTWYHLISGRPPFIAETTYALLRHHIETAPIELRTLVPEVPAPIAELVHACLRKSPAERPASALALV